ncbi:hypothetical protein TTHERM_00784270 (macronuclear) [Tetrahymena thermophila SB210]|uniref:Uncharacterized protein n=1 Tax=Tetrahymena thermophila (strain SB210) TaxID=312017 RepID=Q231R2_TETTS|nr:hypothetical protein TTHERM_00784270 [Tetrahymena thermophila SB210]EAR91240.1 hypothetical protein TTHERM_00784270 [Tetrahymena thermophila SB210]|eukprot:XP_001011485.1 hypothetical protein TTHERM_00784270 [Tetrahymena thermophila SB210]
MSSSSSELQTKEEDENNFSYLIIYEKFPFLKEEKQKFDELVQKLYCKFKDEQAQLLTGNHNFECRESNLDQSLHLAHQSTFSSEFPRLEQIKQKADFTSTYNKFENQQDNSPNLKYQWERYLDLPLEDREFPALLQIEQKAGFTNNTSENQQDKSPNLKLEQLESHLDQPLHPADQSKLDGELPTLQQIEQKADFNSTKNTFENLQDKIPNLNSQELIDSPENQHSLNNSQEQNYLDSSIEKNNRSKRTSINPEQIQETQEVIKQSQETQDIIKQEVLSSLQQIVSNKLQDLLISNKSHMFYGLDDCKIDLNEIKQEQDGRITYNNKQHLQTVTFLISGYLTEDLQASENFQVLKNTKNKESQENLFIFFQWSGIRVFKILDKFLNDVMNNQKPEIYQGYLKILLDSCQNECFSDIVIKDIYWLFELLNICIKQVGISFFQKQIRAFKTVLDSTIEDFQVVYDQAKNGGEILAENINNQKLLRRLNIDFMGHNLGAVATAYAVKKLSMSARYLMFFGGVATIKDIQDNSQKFQMCYNFYSENDIVVKTCQVKAKFVGDQKFVGAIPFGLNNNIFNLNTKIDHLDYMNKYQEYYNLAMKQFKPPSNKVELPKKLNFKKLGLGALLLYLLQDNSKNSQVSIFYLLILYIYQFFNE